MLQHLVSHDVICLMHVWRQQADTRRTAALDKLRERGRQTANSKGDWQQTGSETKKGKERDQAEVESAFKEIERR